MISITPKRKNNRYSLNYRTVKATIIVAIGYISLVTIAYFITQ